PIQRGSRAEVAAVTSRPTSDDRTRLLRLQAARSGAAEYSDATGWRSTTKVPTFVRLQIDGWHRDQLLPPQGLFWLTRYERMTRRSPAKPSGARAAHIAACQIRVLSGWGANFASSK